jgi:hypothetical protein
VSAVEPKADVSRDAAPTDTRNWSTTSRTVWPRLLIAAGIAVALGTGIGYMVGKIPSSSVPGAKIQPSSEGGTRLRFDYDLRKR